VGPRVDTNHSSLGAPVRRFAWQLIPKLRRGGAIEHFAPLSTCSSYPHLSPVRKWTIGHWDHIFLPFVRTPTLNHHGVPN
jgi:hypothetical protein